LVAGSVLDDVLSPTKELEMSAGRWCKAKWRYNGGTRQERVNLSTVFEVSDVGQGNLGISKLLALKKIGPFLRSTYYWVPAVIQFVGFFSFFIEIFVPEFFF
jgi:hypothetical protein